ncbi:hypothetical protein [Halomonas sp. I5-271120]|uniref:hypothetical protein n=1 Tax=Halomonas sp. I5-271120 TaxID=3061632 RepID=UPI002714EBA5|nr:hypothetical protein [Halomonas sp. I5-271120]
MFRLFVALFMLFPVIASASPSWTKRYTVDFRLGDSDSRLDARHAAIEDIKLQAAAESESYVHSTLTYESGELKEREQIVSATMVLLDNIEETFGLTSSGQQVLKLSADATLDDRLLDRRIDALIERESQVETSARQSSGSPLMPSYSPPTQSSTGDPVTVYDELSSYSDEQFENNEVGKESISLESFTTSVSDSEFQYFLEKQLIPRVTEKGVSITPSSVRKEGEQVALSFYLDWELPLDTLRDWVTDHLRLEKNEFRIKNSTGYVVNLERARSNNAKSPDSAFYANTLAEWSGYLVVTINNSSGDESEVYRAPFWFATKYDQCEVKPDTEVVGNVDEARRLCMLHNEYLAFSENREPEHAVTLALSKQEYEATEGISAHIEWEK